MVMEGERGEGVVMEGEEGRSGDGGGGRGRVANPMQSRADAN